jgi:signal transduction histidine kinase/CheY-like chemotaxis protein
MPHGHCYLWHPGLVALHVTSDTLIGISYTAIASTLAFFVYRARGGLPFDRMFLAFGTFIIACGATHFMEIWTLWQPDYWLSGNVKALTAMASVATAVALPPLIPRALRLIDAERISEQRRIDLDARSRLLDQAKMAMATAEEARFQAEEANRIKDQFLAVVSHELRTPLSPILTWTHLLRVDPNADLGEGLATIERAARTQAQIVEDLLDVSRIVSGKLRLDVRPIELEPIVDAAVEAIRPAAAARGIRLQVTLDPKAGPVSGDEGRLQQVFWNLLSNAIKFTPKGGSVSVTLERVSSHIEVTVSDTGCGVPADKMAHLFERFWQADGSTSRAHGGLGLGLAIVRHLVELHGGTVEAHSEGVDRGTTFRVVLPLRVATADTFAAAREHPSAMRDRTLIETSLARLDGKRVLVVDDDEDTVRTLEVLLTMQGADVRTASSARQGLEILGEWLPHVLLSDIGMPETDGYAFIETVRSLAPERGGRVPAIALTAYARVEDRVRVLSSGFEMHVTKPVDPAELLAVVATVARRSRA